MGRIEFYGIVKDYEMVLEKELSKAVIPENAYIVNEYVQMNMNNILFFTLPIIIIIITIVIIKQVKTGFLNKNIRKIIQEENLKRYNLDTNKKKIKFALKSFFKVYIFLCVFMCCITLIHEFLHAIPGVIMEYDMKVAIGFPMGGATWLIEDMTKILTNITKM